jgi:Ca2+-binding EF-hand superfamily protein
MISVLAMFFQQKILHAAFALQCIRNLRVCSLPLLHDSFVECGLHQVIFYWTLVARHLSHCLDLNPKLRPPRQLRPDSETSSHLQISLSSTQQKQIREIFDLFDTDGGGTIDRKELDFAMVAMGFKSKKNKSMQNLNSVDSILADGTVTLEEFNLLMMGEVNGRDPMEETLQIFVILSRPDGERKNDGFITLNKLESACREFQVLHVP